MIYLKSLLAGLAASFAALILSPIAYAFAMTLSSPRGIAVSWDLRSALASPGLLWCYALTVATFFGIGFWLAFRRISH
jgi:hypothetical protein